jgi:hypothetical protein
MPSGLRMGVLDGRVCHLLTHLVGIRLPWGSGSSRCPDAQLARPTGLAPGRYKRIRRQMYSRELPDSMMNGPVEVGDSKTQAGT